MLKAGILLPTLSKLSIYGLLEMPRSKEGCCRGAQSLEHMETSRAPPSEPFSQKPCFTRVFPESSKHELIN